MKRLLLLLFISMSSLLYAQTSICGISWGTPKEMAQRTLYNRFGTAPLIDYDCIMYAGSQYSYAGYLWDELYFQFQFNGKEYVLSEGILAKCFTEFKDAIHFYNTLKTDLLKKYTIVEQEADESYFLKCLGYSDLSSVKGFTLAAKRVPDELNIYTYRIMLLYFGPDYSRDEL